MIFDFLPLFFQIQIQYSTAVSEEFICVALLTNEAIERPKRKQSPNTEFTEIEIGCDDEVNHH